MRTRDKIRYLIEMTVSKWSRLKRIILIMFLGSLLVYGISVGTALLKVWVTQQYKDRYVLVPYHINFESKQSPLELIHPYQLQKIQAEFTNTTIIPSKHNKNVDIKNINDGKEGMVSYSLWNQGYISVHEALMEYYEWDLNDLLRVGNLGYTIQTTHNSDTDMYLPFYYANNAVNTLKYDNILTVHSPHNIHDIIEKVNVSVQDKSFYYALESFSIDELILSLIQFISKILMGISFCIFIVSSSNIGTLMPYFILEYQDEIEVLRMYGMPETTLSNLFLLFTMLILTSALLTSSLVVIGAFKFLSILMGLSFKMPLLKISVLGFIQVILASLLTLGSIKKAMASIAYI